MNLIATLPLLPRFSWIIDALCKAVRDRSSPCQFPPYQPPIMAEFINLICARMRRANSRLHALAALIRAGKLRPTQPRPLARTAARTPRARAASPPILVDRPFYIPRRFAWVLPLVPCHAPCLANQIRHMLTTDAEMHALLAATPRAAKILAPLCRMLGIEPELLTPVRPAPSTVAPATQSDIPVTPWTPETPPTSYGFAPPAFRHLVPG